MHKDATARVYTISSGSYSLPREGSTSSLMLLASSSGFAFSDDEQCVNSRGFRFQKHVIMLLHVFRSFHSILLLNYQTIKSDELISICTGKYIVVVC